MAHYLGWHPDIYLPRKEMNVFGSDLRFGPKFYRRDREAYLDEYAGWQGQLRAGDASVWHLFSTQAAAEIAIFNPEARIIIMLREPAEMLYSLYWQFRYDGNECLPTFEEALEAEEDRRGGRRVSRQAYLVQGLVYRETVRYTEQVRRYFDVFGRERVHVIIYDDFVADVRGCYREVLEFLEVDPSCIPMEFGVINPAKQARSPVLRSVLGDPLLRSAVLALRPRLPRLLFAGLQKLESRLQRSNTRFEKRGPLDPGLKQALHRQFVPEIERLSQLLGRDLRHWRSEEERPPITEGKRIVKDALHERVAAAR